MKNFLLFLCFIFACNVVIAQDEVKTTVEIDSLYKEDQFYLGLTYNLLGNKPTDINQSQISLGFHFGFIKDMPINKNRNVSIGVGLGYSTNSFNNNLFVNEAENGMSTYQVIDDDIGDYSKNKLAQHLIELPIEFRWRTSTPERYKFWRIYTGFKLGYLLSSTTKFNGDLGSFKNRKNKDFNDLQYGVSLSAGYNTWNIYAYYGLNAIFNDNATLNNKHIDMNVIKIGLMFYIL